VPCFLVQVFMGVLNRSKETLNTAPIPTGYISPAMGKGGACFTHAPTQQTTVPLKSPKTPSHNTPMPTPRETQYHTALQLHSKPEPTPLSTGIPLDKLLGGGLKPPHLHLFYGEDNTPDKLLTRLTVEAVKTGGHTIHIVCGDYRRNPTTLDIEDLLHLLETQNMDVEDALSRIRIIPASSQHQQLNTPRLVEQLMEIHETRLLTIQQISKLFYSRNTPSLVDPGEFKGIVSRLREICAKHSVALAASCRAKKRGTDPIPEPVGGSYLRHSAAVQVYLRGQRGGAASAILVKHYDRARVGMRISFHRGEGELGRIIGSSTRKRIQDTMRLLRSMYREALKDDEMQEAFDEVWQSWTTEEGAMIYSEVASALDLLNLTGVIANRREIRRLRARLKALEAHDEDRNTPRRSG